MRVLVSGGAGYIGSHTVVQLVAAGHEVVVVDSFANAKPSVVGRVEALTGQPLDVRSFDLTDHDKTEHLFAHEHIDAVIHFAGFKAVGESVAKPLEYYENNIGSTFSLVRAMRRHGVSTTGLLLLRHRLRRERPGADDRGPADLGDQPVRLDQGDAGADPARRRRRRPALADRRCCATSTRSARTRPARSARTPPTCPTT